LTWYGPYHAFLYEDGQMKDLGTLGGTTMSIANAINDSGQVVGTSGSRAFLYQNEEMIDLGNRLHPDNNGNIWNLYSVSGINNEGRIVGAGRSSGGDDRALLLTPKSDSQAPSPPTITSPTDKTTTSNGTPTISGTAEAYSTATIYDGSTKLGTARTNGSGNWTFTPSSALSDGEHSLTATATDAAGNTSSASKAVTLTVDKPPPRPPSPAPKTTAATQTAPLASLAAPKPVAPWNSLTAQRPGQSHLGFPRVQPRLTPPLEPGA
jgi:probable HAF family extracellular repeat protein